MSPLSPDFSHWALSAGKLAAAALCGLALTAVSAGSRKQRRSLFEPLDQAQILLCVTGALMMIVIGDSLARAFGVAGAAGIIRFRTPVEDPRDTIRMFLLMGLGMACGLGAFAVALLGTVFLAALTLCLDRAYRRSPEPQAWTLEVTADRSSLQIAEIHKTLSRGASTFEPRSVCENGASTLKYSVSVDFPAALERLNSSLLEASGVRSVSWSAKK